MLLLKISRNVQMMLIANTDCINLYLPLMNAFYVLNEPHLHPHQLKLIILTTTPTYL